MNNKIKIIAVIGPTASGKTGLAVEIAIDLKSKDCMEIKTKNSIVVCKSFEEMLETIREND